MVSFASVDDDYEIDKIDFEKSTFKTPWKKENVSYA